MACDDAIAQVDCCPPLSKHISLKPLQLCHHRRNNNDLSWLFFSSPSAESESVLVVKQPQEEPAIPVEQLMTVVMEDKKEDVIIKEEESPQDKALEPKEVGQQVQDFWMAEEDKALIPQCHCLSEVMPERPCPRLQCHALYTLSQCLLQAWKEQ